MLILADKYEVDLGAVFGRTMDELQAAIETKLSPTTGVKGQTGTPDTNG